MPPRANPEASASSVTGFVGSKCLRMGIVVNEVLRLPKDSYSSLSQTNRVSFFLSNLAETLDEAAIEVGEA
jgi:hypothetical protein